MFLKIMAVASKGLLQKAKEYKTSSTITSSPAELTDEAKALISKLEPIILELIDITNNLQNSPQPEHIKVYAQKTFDLIQDFSRLCNNRFLVIYLNDASAEWFQYKNVLGYSSSKYLPYLGEDGAFSTIGEDLYYIAQKLHKMYLNESWLPQEDLENNGPQYRYYIYNYIQLLPQILKFAQYIVLQKPSPDNIISLSDYRLANHR